MLGTLDCANLFPEERDAYLELVRRVRAALPEGYLLANRGFDASAPNYGLIPKDPSEALAGACPIVASYGARDRGLKCAASQLETALSALGVTHDVKEYPDAGHSFLNRHNTGVPLNHLERIAGFSYHHPSAEDAWNRIQRFFHTHLSS